MTNKKKYGTQDLINYLVDCLGYGEDEIIDMGDEASNLIDNWDEFYSYIA